MPAGCWRSASNWWGRRERCWMSFRAGRDGTLIVGYGNSLRGDDAVGLLAAGRLAGCGYDAVAVPQLLPELAARMAAARRVIFIDAHTSVAPGGVAIDRVEPRGGGNALEHFTGL